MLPRAAATPADQSCRLQLLRHPPGRQCSHPPTTRRTQCSKRGLKTITCGGGGWLHNRKSTCPHLPTWGSTLMTYGFVLIMRCFVIQPFDAYCFLVSFQSVVSSPIIFLRILKGGHMDFITTHVMNSPLYMYPTLKLQLHSNS